MDHNLTIDTSVNVAEAKAYDTYDSVRKGAIYTDTLVKLFRIAVTAAKSMAVEGERIFNKWHIGAFGFSTCLSMPFALIKLGKDLDQLVKSNCKKLTDRVVVCLSDVSPILIGTGTIMSALTHVGAIAVRVLKSVTILQAVGAGLSLFTIARSINRWHKRYQASQDLSLLNHQWELLDIEAKFSRDIPEDLLKERLKKLGRIDLLKALLITISMVAAFILLFCTPLLPVSLCVIGGLIIIDLSLDLYDFYARKQFCSVVNKL